MNSFFSSSEKMYVIQGCNAEKVVRYDGRLASDYRMIFVENNVFPHCNGSSRVKISDNIEVLCSVKVNYN